jgi:hypothetical protein
MSLTGNGTFGPPGISGPRIVPSQGKPALTGFWEGCFVCISNSAIINAQEGDIWVNTNSNSVWQWSASLHLFTALTPAPELLAFIAGLKLSTPGYYDIPEPEQDPAPLPEVCSTEEAEDKFNAFLAEADLTGRLDVMELGQKRLDYLKAAILKKAEARTKGTLRPHILLTGKHEQR